uniref:Uncharacterized protein n=1 Tax=Arundo donax TaxID=35708 RepID=A0A0A9C0I3_ARUDO
MSKLELDELLDFCVHVPRVSLLVVLEQDPIV